MSSGELTAQRLQAAREALDRLYKAVQSRKGQQFDYLSEWEAINNMLDYVERRIRN